MCLSSRCGVFNHVDTSTPKPNTILGSGTGKATGLVSFTVVATYGGTAAGILTIPSRAVMPATLTIVCYIPFIPLVTGKDA